MKHFFIKRILWSTLFLIFAYIFTSIIYNNPMFSESEKIFFSIITGGLVVAIANDSETKEEN